MKYVDNLDVKVEKDAVTFDLRVGWSSNKGSLMLGEDDQSWCYSSAEGKMAHMKTFEEYGEKFTKGDVVGAYIDFEGDEVSLTFTKNGEDQGDAFQIPKAELNGEALFPHIMARNVKFDVNFGLDKEDKVMEDLKEKLDGAYIKAGSVPLEQRVRGSARIATREECELVMMVGLPAAGKTTWVEKHVADNPDKQYNVISTTTMINKMTVSLIDLISWKVDKCELHLILSPGEWRAAEEAPHRQVGVGGAEGDQEPAGDVEGCLAKKEERYHRPGRRLFPLLMLTVVCCPSMTCAPDDIGCTVCIV